MSRNPSVRLLGIASQLINQGSQSSCEACSTSSVNRLQNGSGGHVPQLVFSNADTQVTSLPSDFSLLTSSGEAYTSLSETDDEETVVEQELTFTLHPKQMEIYCDKHRFQIAQCGRRFGKTELAWIKCLTAMLEKPNVTLWWVAPYYSLLIPATKVVRKLTPHVFVEKRLEAGNVVSYLRLTNGSECYFRSADRENSLRGSGLDGVVIDEAPILKESRWEEEIKPMLMDRNGWALFIGTPFGTTWFTKLFQRGQDGSDPEYRSWQLSSYCNTVEAGGFIPKEYLDSIANSMPEQKRRQEIFAETISNEGIVFRHINDRVRQFPAWKHGETVVVGCDLAKQSDFTVLIALRVSDGAVVGFERFNRLDWPIIRAKAVSFAKRFDNAAIMIDSTGVGDPTFDDLSREYQNVAGYKLTNSTKAALIEGLMLALDNDEVHFAGTVDGSNVVFAQPQLQSELQSFAYELSPSGNTIYNAPEGLYDDCVIALALAVYQAKTAYVKPSFDITSSRRSW